MLGIWTYTLAFPWVSQGPLLKALKGHIKVLGSWCWLFLVWPFSKNGINSSLQWVSLESLWPSSPLLHVLCPDWDPSVPMLGTRPEDTSCPFHFSLRLDFDRTFNESFLYSRIHVSGLFLDYLLAIILSLSPSNIERLENIFKFFFFE